METILIRTLQLIMSLSLLVIIHESGHFLFARLFKIRVEKFCLFFDPWFTLFKFKPKNSDTQYGIGWLPLGGYVKISGMIDESMDTEQMKQPVQPWEFRAKPTWQRLLVMTGGVLFNFILALFIYSMILYAWGDSYIPLQKAEMGMQFNETAKNIGFRDGDILLTADGKELTRYDADMLRQIVDARIVIVLRENRQEQIYIPDNMMQSLIADSMRFASYRFPFVVDSVIPDSPAAIVGIQQGDTIKSLNGKPVAYYDFMNDMAALREQAVTSGKSTASLRRVEIIRSHIGGVIDTLTLTTDSLFKIGVYNVADPTKLLPVVQVHYGFFESFPTGILLGVNTLKGYVSDMKHIFSKEGAKQLGGFATIGSIFPAQWDWHQFWYMTAFLSIILAFMNILPIPALDGGHVLFLLYEIITRRKPNDKFMEYAQITGMILLFGLLILANFNDILRFLF
ncbi:putative zinc metalloprotease [termite gut metagenome]|uniref:Putative zinc metalloprotease n=1 Tax=termite gut metagenome TaxID=433724 RepID=A0A5J4SXD4_9ZZZZ